MKILRIIRSRSVWERGIYQNEIIPLAKLSRQAVYNHLKKLTEEGRIMKSRGYVRCHTNRRRYILHPYV